MSKPSALYKLADLLARRDHSEKELIEKLSRKFSAEEVKTALHKARENKWLPDPQELAQKVAEQLANKGKSQSAINLYLRKKGLPKALVSEDVQITQAVRLLEKKFGEIQNHLDRRKAKVFLARRGFSLHVGRQALQELAMKNSPDRQER